MGRAWRRCSELIAAGQSQRDRPRAANYGRPWRPRWATGPLGILPPALTWPPSLPQIAGRPRPLSSRPRLVCATTVAVPAPQAPRRRPQGGGSPPSLRSPQRGAGFPLYTLVKSTRLTARLARRAWAAPELTAPRGRARTRPNRARRTVSQARRVARPGWRHGSLAPSLPLFISPRRQRLPSGLAGRRAWAAAPLDCARLSPRSPL